MKFFYLLITFVAFISINNTYAQEITMFPGFWKVKYYQDDTQISKKQVESLMLNDSEANQLWRKSKKHMTIGYLAVGVEFGFLIWQLNRENNNESQTVPFVGVLASAGVAIGFTLSASNLRKDAILKYNKNADIGTLNFGPTYNGLGLVLQF